MLKKVRRLLSTDGSTSVGPIESQVRCLDNLLEKYYNCPVYILKEEISTPVTSPGSTYKIELKLDLDPIKTDDDKEITTAEFFLKLIHQEQHETDVPIEVDLIIKFKKEIEVYSSAIRFLKEFEMDNGVVPEERSYDKLFPKCFAARISALDDHKLIPDNTAAIVLENLSLQGYKIEDIPTGFDLATSKLVVENLAQFHAVPLSYRRLKILLFQENITHCMVYLKKCESKSDYYKAIDGFIRYGIQGHPELESHKAAIDAAIHFSKFNARFRRLYSNQNWQTMCHSSYWIRNIMVKRDEESNPISSKIIDLQTFEYASCFNDLTFFLFTSVETEILQNNLDDILTAYFDAFTRILVNLKVDTGPYSYEKFINEFNLQGPRVLMDILENLRYVAYDSYDENGEPVLGEKYRLKVRDILLIMLNRGWMDVLA